MLSFPRLHFFQLSLGGSVLVGMLGSITILFERIGLPLSRPDSMGASSLLLQSTMRSCLPSLLPRLGLPDRSSGGFCTSPQSLTSFRSHPIAARILFSPAELLQEHLAHRDVLDEVLVPVGTSKGHDPDL